MGKVEKLREGAVLQSEAYADADSAPEPSAWLPDPPALGKDGS